MNAASLEGKAAIVTGAGRGIGREIALHLALNGVNVVVNDPGFSFDGQTRDEGVASAVADEIAKTGGRAIANFGSVAEPGEAADLIGACVNEFGTVDILVNNAGLTSGNGLMETTPEEFSRVVGVSLLGSFYCSQLAAPHMLRAGWGRIVNFVSRAGIVGMGGATAYAAAKGGVFGLTNSIARDLLAHGILVNAVNPGPTRTRMVTEALGPDRDPAFRERDERILSTMQDPGQLAPLVAYLCSDACKEAGQVFLMDQNRISRMCLIGPECTTDADPAWSVEKVAAAVGAFPERKLSDT